MTFCFLSILTKYLSVFFIKFYFIPFYPLSFLFLADNGYRASIVCSFLLFSVKNGGIPLWKCNFSKTNLHFSQISGKSSRRRLAKPFIADFHFFGFSPGFSRHFFVIFLSISFLPVRKFLLFFILAHVSLEKVSIFQKHRFFPIFLHLLFFPHKKATPQTDVAFFYDLMHRKSCFYENVPCHLHFFPCRLSVVPKRIGNFQFLPLIAAHLMKRQKLHLFDACIGLEIRRQSRQPLPSQRILRHHNVPQPYRFALCLTVIQQLFGMPTIAAAHDLTESRFQRLNVQQQQICLIYSLSAPGKGQGTGGVYGRVEFFSSQRLDRKSVV